MGEVKVEHVLLFLIGAFLVYQMMGKCRSVEGVTPDCNGTGVYSLFREPGNYCRSIGNKTDCNNSYDSGKSLSAWGARTYYGAKQCVWEGNSCHEGEECIPTTYTTPDIV